MMVQGFVRVTIIIAFVALIAVFSVVGMGLVIDGTRLLTMTTENTDGTFYADLTDACDDFQSVNCG